MLSRDFCDNVGTCGQWSITDKQSGVAILHRVVIEDLEKVIAQLRMFEIFEKPPT